MSWGVGVWTDRLTDETPRYASSSVPASRGPARDRAGLVGVPAPS